MKAYTSDELGRFLQALDERAPFRRETLVRRFLAEMTHVIGPRPRLVRNFLAALELLFGKPAADALEPRIRRHRHWSDVLP